MRILMVNEFEVYGGAETHLKALSEGLRQKGHKVELLAKFKDWQREPSAKWKALTEIRNSFKPEVLHFHNVFALTEPLAFAVGTGFPHLLSLHDYWPFCPMRNLILNKFSCPQPCQENCSLVQRRGGLLKELVRAASLRITFNPTSASILEAHGLHCEVIPHGVDIEEFKPAPLKTSQVVFLMAKEGIWEKGERYFDAILQEGGGKGLKIIGQPQKKVKETLAQSLIFINTGVYQETFCLTVAEAMAAGCAVISFDTAGPHHLLAPDTGFLVPIADVQGAVLTLHNLLSNPQRAVKIGFKARRHIVEHFNLGQEITSYEAIYQRVAGDGR